MVAEEYAVFPRQSRLASSIRISLGERTDKGAPKKSDRILMTQRNGFVEVGKMKAPRYTLNPQLQTRLIKYLKDREVDAEDIGPVPQRVPIILPYNDPEENLYTALAVYGASARVCYNETRREKTDEECDQSGVMRVADARAAGKLMPEHYTGTAFQRIKRGEAYETVQAVCDPATCQHFRKGECKPQVVLTCLLRDIVVGSNPLATLHSTGWQTWDQLLHMQRDILRRTGGLLAGIPLWLVRGERPVQLPGGGKTYQPYMTIAYDGDLAELPKLARAIKEERIQLDAMDVPALPARVAVEDEQQQAAFAPEFHPESANAPDYIEVDPREVEIEALCEAAGYSTVETDELIRMARQNEDASDVLADLQAEVNVEAADAEFTEAPAFTGQQVVDRMRELMKDPEDEWAADHMNAAIQTVESENASIQRGKLPKSTLKDADTWQSIVNALRARAAEFNLTDPFPEEAS